MGHRALLTAAGEPARRNRKRFMALSQLLVTFACFLFLDLATTIAWADRAGRQNVLFIAVDDLNDCVGHLRR